MTQPPDSDDTWAHSFGITVLAEYSGCDAELLNDRDGLPGLIEQMAAESGLNVIATYRHLFHPVGETVICLLSESHLAFHSWPEHDAATLDLFSCGDPRIAEAAARTIGSAFGATVVMKTIPRLHGAVGEANAR